MVAAQPQAARETFRAAKKGDLAALCKLLKADPSLVHARDKEGSTPLHWAAWRGQVEAVRLLLEAGAEVNARNQNTHWGTTPLHAAAHGNQAAVAQLLLEYGGDVHSKNLNKRTPLEETAIHDARAAAAVLRAAGATE
ncbi:MAG TPA: ankyrin repeat domain-containing protein [Candidatus Xenobia bacterium]|nr:ankyrin repeat domain-containing protein [Candidatus Xenobia bacterium]